MKEFTKHLSRWALTAAFAWWFLLLSPLKQHDLHVNPHQPLHLAVVMGPWDSGYDCSIGALAIGQRVTEADSIGCWDDGNNPGPWSFEVFDTGGADHVDVAAVVSHFGSHDDCQTTALEARTLHQHATVTDCSPDQ